MLNFLRLARPWPILAFFALSACEPRLDTTYHEEHAIDVLRVGFPPDENPDEIRGRNKPLLEYIRKYSGIKKLEVIVQPSYTATIEDLQNHKLDLVYLGGLTYVLAKNTININPLASGLVNGRSDTRAFIIARRDSNIQTLPDLVGLRFAFGDVASTSGHLIPHQAMIAAGIHPHKDFETLLYTGAQDKTVYAVQSGRVDAGAISARMYNTLVKRQIINEAQIKVIWRSPSFADYTWAIRADLDPQLINTIQLAFINLHDKALLEHLGVDGYQITRDAEFGGIRDAAIKLGFMQAIDAQ